MPKRRGTGEGGVEKLPSGSYRAVCTKTVDGKRVRSSKSFPTKQEAQDWLREQLKHGPTAAGTLGDWLDKWLTIIKPNVAAKTYQHDEIRVRLHIKPALGTVRLRDLTGVKVAEWLSKMHADGSSDSERQKCGSVLRKSLNAAIGAGVMPVNPMARVKLPTPKRDEKRPLDGPQLASIIAAADELRELGHVFRFWADSGLRPGELFALTWEDFNLTTGTVRITKSLDSLTHKLKDPKTRKSRRTIQLDAGTVSILRGQESTGVFLPDSKGGMFWASNFSEDVFAPIAEKAGVPWATPYTLRHTMATLLLRAAVPLKVVSERLGHEDVTTTLRTYAHVMEGDQSKAAAAMGAILPPVG